MAEPTWSLYFDDSFQHADTTVAGTPKSNTGVPTPETQTCRAMTP